jgi:hypothetical protein
VTATRQLIFDAILDAPACPDGPTGACPSCLAHAIDEALAIGAAKDRHPAGSKRRDDQLDLMQAVCSHVWPPELDGDARCQLCDLRYSEWSEAGR